MNLQNKITSMLAKDRKVMTLGLDTIKALLNCLGNPERKMPPIIHIAGTNGKGSTVAFLRAMLQEEGKKVHVYTSPHFVRWNERIVVSGQIIADEYLAELLQKVEKTADENNISCSFFELLTAAAFTAFSEKTADYVLLETGLGGRLDATNAVKNTLCSIITSISKDHTDFLGDTLEQIAYEKACIIKENSTAIAAAAKPSVLKVFKDFAESKHSDLLVEGEDFILDDKDENGFLYNDTYYSAPALLGRHQYHNAALAITAAKKVLGLSDEAIRKGLQSVRWDGRLQRLDSGKVANMLPSGWELWIDGGHNQGAAQVLSDFLPTWQDKPLYGVWGMITSKNPDEFISPLTKFFKGIWTVGMSAEHNCYSCRELAETAAKYGAKTQESTDFLTAIRQITTQQKTEKGRILIFGSLYLLGDVLKENDATVFYKTA